MASGSAIISSDAIALRFARLKEDGRRAFVPYVTAGHPDAARSVALLQGLEQAGADVVEVGAMMNTVSTPWDLQAAAISPASSGGRSSVRMPSTPALLAART